MEANDRTPAASALGFPSLDCLPKGGMAPLAATREQSVADSVERGAEFQKAFPGVDWQSAVIEPTINMSFDLKEKLDPPTYDTHQCLLADMIKHLSPPSGEEEEERDGHDSEDAQNSMAKAQEAFWEARKCLEGHDDLLGQFDAVYLREDRPLEVMLGQLRETFTLRAKMRAAASAAAAEVSSQDNEVKTEGKGIPGGSEQIA